MVTSLNLEDPLIPRISDRTNAVFIDVNPRLGANNYAELIYDEVAIIQGSILNLLQCPVGERGALFQPEYGTPYFSSLHEPMAPVTAMQLRAQVIQSLERWEPRIDLIHSQTTAQVDYSMPGYILTIAFVLKVSRRVGRTIVNLPVMSA